MYVEGFELDVQDPAFFMDKEEYTITRNAIDEVLITYAVSLAEQE